MGLKDRFVFQQDLDLKHMASAARDFFAENHIVQLLWSLQSPYANPIKILWSILDYSVPITERMNKTRFFATLQKSWYDLDKDVLKKLVEQFLAVYYISLRLKAAQLAINLLIKSLFNSIYSQLYIRRANFCL